MSAGARQSRAMVFIDIGATLVNGPTAGPASRLATALSLDDVARNLLKDWLLTVPLQQPEQLADLLIERLGVDRRSANVEAGPLWRAQREEATAIPGASGVVHALRMAGFRVGIISNIWRPYYDSVVSALPSLFAGADRCSPVVLSHEIGSRKPDVEVFSYAMKAAAVDPTETLMVGDSYAEDILPALTLGMKAIWVLHRPQSEVEAITGTLNGETPTPQRTLSSILELTAPQIDQLFSDRDEIILN